MNISNKLFYHDGYFSSGDRLTKIQRGRYLNTWYKLIQKGKNIESQYYTTIKKVVRHNAEFLGYKYPKVSVIISIRNNKIWLKGLVNGCDNFNYSAEYSDVKNIDDAIEIAFSIMWYVDSCKILDCEKFLNFMMENGGTSKDYNY